MATISINNKTITKSYFNFLMKLSRLGFFRRVDLYRCQIVEDADPSFVVVSSNGTPPVAGIQVDDGDVHLK